MYLFCFSLDSLRLTGWLGWLCVCLIICISSLQSREANATGRVSKRRRAMPFIRKTEPPHTQFLTVSFCPCTRFAHLNRIGKNKSVLLCVRRVLPEQLHRRRCCRRRRCRRRCWITFLFFLERRKKTHTHTRRNALENVFGCDTLRHHHTRMERMNITTTKSSTEEENVYT